MEKGRKGIGKGFSIADARDIPAVGDITSTAEVPIPQDPLARVIGQDKAVGIAHLAAVQHRHLLLVGPPGTGKSMIAQALGLHLPPPTQQIQVVHNPQNPERPFVEVLGRDEVLELEEHLAVAEGAIISPEDAPRKVADQLGYRCPHCGAYSAPEDGTCPKCERRKVKDVNVDGQPFGDLLGNIMEVTLTQFGGGKKSVRTTRVVDGREEVVTYERHGDKIKMLDQRALEKLREIGKESPSKVLVPLKRKSFVLATGSSETELLGDVRHDPYGGHVQLGTPPYERVVAGSIHEAHEGVLFIDELPHLGHLQRFILTAMQEKKFPISGRHPQSAGASVKVPDVPCDFIFVGACNIQDLHHILSPLRSRINGSGYEVLMDTVMPRTEDNAKMLLQFTAQEIEMDRRIPHASAKAFEGLLTEAVRRAKALDGKDDCYTLRLRGLGGVIRTAGDLAMLDGKDLIGPGHIVEAVKRCKSAEEQIKERYGSYYAGLARDISGAQRSSTSPYNYWESHINDDRTGYE
jgi:ATP-dependent Lon protease